MVCVSGWRRVKLVVGATVWLGVLGVASGPVVRASVDAPVDAGSVEMIDPDTMQPLTSGDSNTVFTLGLPDEASCPGDSANDDWRVQSFLVPAADDPGALRYGIIRADGDGRFAIYTVQTQPFVHILTGQNVAPGLPGRIASIPPLSFGVFPAGTLEMENYRLGIACTLYRETARYWDTEIVLSAAPDVQPGEFTWQVVGATPAGPGTTDTDSMTPLVLVVVAAGVATAAVVMIRSRRTRASQPQAVIDSKETV